MCDETKIMKSLTTTNEVAINEFRFQLRNKLTKCMGLRNEYISHTIMILRSIKYDENNVITE